ncbi:hypothetical protein CMS34_22935 [Salmonella enterica]|nr:hypothetical protein [Salmonella enterica]
MKRFLLVALLIPVLVHAEDKTVYCFTPENQVVSVTPIKKTGIMVMSTTADKINIIASRTGKDVYEILSTMGNNNGKVNNEYPSDVYFNGHMVELSQGNHSILMLDNCKKGGF